MISPHGPNAWCQRRRPAAGRMFKCPHTARAWRAPHDRPTFVAPAPTPSARPPKRRHPKATRRPASSLRPELRPTASTNACPAADVLRRRRASRATHIPVACIALKPCGSTSTATNLVCRLNGRNCNESRTAAAGPRRGYSRCRCHLWPRPLPSSQGSASMDLLPAPPSTCITRIGRLVPKAL